MTHTTVLPEADRTELTATFVSRRVLEVEGDRVRRLLVATPADERLALFVPPGGDPLPDLRTGASYRFGGVLGCAVPGPADRLDSDCPACGGPLRHGRPIDAFPAVRRAVDRLDLDGPVAVLDRAVSVRAAAEETVDDWRARPGRGEPQGPPFVCPACGQSFAGQGLRLSDDQVTRFRHDTRHQVTTNAAAPSAETVGLATGGAKDVENFRANVREGYTPQPEAITDEGLFYDYHFETGASAGETDALFAPRYAGGASDHPLTGEREAYLSVGLDSTLALGDFERPRLDLVAVLDVSGSMDAAFDQYYYDERGHRREVPADERSAETKLAAAIESLCALTDQLRPDDRFGVVLFNNRAHVAKPLRDVAATDMDAIRGHVRDVAAGGGTNMADGFEAATDLLADAPAEADTERRVVFLTDAMPNAGTTDEDGLASLIADAAADGIHTTFVGMGIDANAELVDALSGIRGANHYFVHSAADFERRLGEEFAYMVTPLVYDLGLELRAEGFEIEAVHGSPTGDAATGRLAHVGTLFPSPTEDGETRGGVILVRLARTGDEDPAIDLVASWTERGGEEHSERVRIDPPTRGYDHGGVRKAVALARYARVLRSWARDVHERAHRSSDVDDWLLPRDRGEHERESVRLVVPDEHAERLAAVRDYLAAEADAPDVDFGREVDVLDRLLDARERLPGVEEGR